MTSRIGPDGVESSEAAPPPPPHPALVADEAETTTERGARRGRTAALDARTLG